MKQKFRISMVAVILLASNVAACGGSSSSTPAPIVTPNLPDVTNVDTDGNTSVDPTLLSDQLALMPVGALTSEEEAGLLFMREEEKLAYDVYSQLAMLWQQNVFTNIASSEFTHTEAVLLLLERYNVSDPVGSNPIGVFVDPALQGLHDMLVARGTNSLIDALIVGAEIEEIDILDLETHLAALVDNDDIALVYQSLQKGSRNHLRAFVRALESQNITYAPQHLTTSEYEAIINSPTETGGNGQ